ncbi:MAG: hypothetical protein JXC32_18130 [Anaerolineae bacterium]|nr:hypothetical protein [Anaerolineae bacterium]
MSDENQPNDVVESQFESGAMPVEPLPAEPVTAKLDSAEPEVGQTVAESEVAAPVGSPREAPAAQALIPGATVVEMETDETAPGAVEETPDAQAIAAVRSVVDTPRPEDAGAAAAADGSASAEASAPRVVSIAAMERPRSRSKAPAASGGQPALAGIASALAGRGWILGVVAVVIVLLLALFVPPLSLAQRIGNGGGYAALDEATPSVTHPDGLTVTRSWQTDTKLRLKLGSTPRADFSAGGGPEELRPAAEAVPAYLEPKSPYYSIDARSKEPVGGELRVVIPNESEPWETLDLYTWDGETWTWLPTQLDRANEALISEVAALPGSVMVMQSVGGVPRVVAEVDSWPAADASDTVDGASVSGILIGTMGGTTGSLDDLPAASSGGAAELVPTVRNWVPDRAANWALVSDMLKMGSDRAAHVTNLLALAQTGGYPGLVVDYSLVQAEDRELFTQFVTELGAAFDEAGLWLGVAVDAPQSLAGGGWQTGGYDWAALGAVVDQLRFDMPLAPDAYVPGGSAEQLVQWATSQVDRHKLMPVYSTLSTDGTNAVSMETVLASLGEVSVMQTLTESVIPGTQLNMSLGQVGVLQDPETQATSIVAGDATYYLGTPQWLRTRLDLATHYRLGGVVLTNLFDPGNMAGLLPALADFKAGGAGTAASMPEIVWAVTDPAGQTTSSNTQMTAPGFAWVAPEVTGTYRIEATVAGVDKGSLAVTVAAPAPVVTDTLAEGEAEEEEEASAEAGGAGASEEVEVDETLKAGFVADVSVPDNTRFEKGEDFTKTWRLVNNGDVDWPEDTVLVFAKDTNLSESEEVEVGEVTSGENVEISVDMVAPDEDGTYRSTWELRADGKAISGGLIYVQIVVGEPAAEEPPAAETPAAETPVTQPVVSAPVASGSFELGGHIRDLGLPYKDKMRYAGMNWIKTQIFYGQDANGMVAAAHGNGFKIQLSAIGGADMVTQSDFEAKFAAWVGQLAAAGADAIEVWNEPNIDREWKVGLISPASYTSLLCASYNAIKTANPGTAVISAAPSPTGWFGGCGPNGCDDAPWMQGLYNAGAARCMDYIGAHHNAGATSPSARIGHPANPGDPHHSWFFLPQTELYYNTFGGTRKLFYTEMGYASQEGVPTFSDQFAWARGTDNSEQAAWLAEAVRLSVNTGMVRAIVVWNIDFVRYGYDPQDGYAIIRPGGGCPACETLHQVLGSR